MNQELTQREREILREVVTHYIACSEPISSRYLSKMSKFSLSPATIRNVMLDLEEKGYLFQPHVSSGRIPTDKGLRFYIQELFIEGIKSPKFLKQINEAFTSSDYSQIIETIPKIMATLTHQIGLFIAPHFGHIPLRSLDFIPVDENRVLAILIARSGTILNKLINIDSLWTRRELSVISRYLTAKYSGKTLFQIRSILAKEPNLEGIEGEFLPKSIKLSQKIIEELDEIEPIHMEADLTRENATNLLIRLKNSFKENSKLFEILNKCIQYDVTQVFIGEETNFTQKFDCAIVASKYGFKDQTLGALGIIGPKTMPYHLVIPVVQETAKILSKSILSKED